jgi:hypothetical protein
VVWNVGVGGSACFQTIDNKRFTGKVYLWLGLWAHGEGCKGLDARLAVFGVDLCFKCIELGGVIMPTLEKIYRQC